MRIYGGEAFSDGGTRTGDTTLGDEAQRNVEYKSVGFEDMPDPSLSLQKVALRTTIVKPLDISLSRDPKTPVPDAHLQVLPRPPSILTPSRRKHTHKHESHDPTRHPHSDDSPRRTRTFSQTMTPRRRVRLALTLRSSSLPSHEPP